MQQLDCRHSGKSAAFSSAVVLGKLSTAVINGRLGGSPGVLVDHPVGGGLLGVPGLEELFGELAQLFGIRRAINDSVEPLDLKSLPKRQFNR
ncbi:MAG: hypothetical protein ACK46L_16925 [Synechococcaceae cyanobacterium]